MFQAIHDLIIYYSQRKDLQESFPEVLEGNLKNLLIWAAYASQNLYNDEHAFSFLKQYAEFYFQASKYENFLPFQNWHDLPKLFFILAAGRSGTNLLKRILNCHSMIRVSAEAVSYNCIANPLCLKYERIFEAKKRWFGLKSIGLTECLLDKNSFLFPIKNHEKTISEKFREFYDKQPIIFLIRDVRDRVSSMLRFIDKTSPNTNETCKTFLSLIEENQFIRKNFHEDLSKILGKDEKLPSILALEWKIKNYAFLKYQEKGFPIIKVRYEDLVLRTESTLQDITSFLNVPFEKTLLNFYNMPHEGLRDTNVDRNFDDTRRGPDTASIGLYKKYLNSQQIDEIMEISSDMMRKLGYHDY